MSEFDFIAQKNEYEKIYKLCCAAENASDAGSKAKCCRDALEEIIKFLYVKESKNYPANATLLEVIDSPFICSFVKSISSSKPKSISSFAL